MNHWHTPEPATPRNVMLGAWLLAAAIVLMTIILVAGKAGASPAVVRCGGPCPTVPTTTPQTVPTTIGTTTTVATTIPATTVPPTTVPPTPGIPGFCQPDPAFPNKMCLNIEPPPTTVPVTTTVPAVTTTAAPTTVASPPPSDTTAVDQTVAPVVTPAPVVVATPEGELPHTGSNLWLAVFGVCLLALGGLLVAFKRS